jgi:hypothetical protein
MSEVRGGVFAKRSLKGLFGMDKSACSESGEILKKSRCTIIHCPLSLLHWLAE